MHKYLALLAEPMEQMGMLEERAPSVHSWQRMAEAAVTGEEQQQTVLAVAAAVAREVLVQWE